MGRLVLVAFSRVHFCLLKLQLLRPLGRRSAVVAATLSFELKLLPLVTRKPARTRVAAARVSAAHRKSGRLLSTSRDWRQLIPHRSRCPSDRSTLRCSDPTQPAVKSPNTNETIPTASWLESTCASQSHTLDVTAPTDRSNPQDAEYPGVTRQPSGPPHQTATWSSTATSIDLRLSFVNPRCHRCIVRQLPRRQQSAL